MPNWSQEIRKHLVGLNLSALREIEIIEELSQHLEERYQELCFTAVPEDRRYKIVLEELADSQFLKTQLRKVERQFDSDAVILGARRANMIGDLFQDIKYGLRVFAKNPGFTAVAVITLALGIGANTAIFSLVNGILLQPLPYHEPDQLVRIIQQNKTLGLATWGVSQANFGIYRDQGQSFESIAAYAGGGANLTGSGEPERINTTAVTADFFKVLGTNPTLGRTFRAGEDAAGKNNVCVISNGLWLRRFGGDPQIIGKSVILNDVSTEIVGVAPVGFQFPSPLIEIWTPYPLNTGKIGGPYLFRSIARLKHGIQPERAESETTAILQAYGREHPNSGEGAGIDTPNGAKTLVTPLKEAIVGNTQKPLLVLLSAVALVLLIACANVANLLLARATSRTKEMAVRFSLGATPSRVARQLLTESLLLSLIGAATGIGLAWLGITMLDRFPVAGIPRINEVTMNGRVLGFTVGIALFTGLFFGLMPAIRAYRMGLSVGMREGGRGSVSSRKLNSGLVAVQFALSLILLIGAALLLKSFQRLESVGIGFNPAGMVTMSASVPGRQPSTQFFTDLAERMRHVPGVKVAGVTTNLPFSNEGGYQDGFLVEGQDSATGTTFETEQAEYSLMTPDTFKAMGIPLLAGRDFQETDIADGQLVAIIDETLAKRYFPRGDAVGKRIESSGDRDWMTIVGIVGGIKHRSLAEPIMPHIYMPMTQSSAQRGYLIIRTDAAASSLVSSVRAEVKELNPNIPIYQIRGMEEIVSLTLASQRLTNLLLTSFSVIALLLAAVGIYGTMSVYVGSRTNEFGIRLALGAQPVSLLRSILGEGLLLTAIGIVVGITGALFLTRTITSLLFEVSATDPVVYTGIPLLLVVVSLLACFVPARRAAKVDPIIALRYE